MRGRKVEAICVGASAGGVAALLEIFNSLPPDFDVPVMAVLHIPSTDSGILTSVFQRKISLKVKEAEDKEEIKSGHFYFAPPAYHLLVEKDRSFSLSTEEPVQYSRPAIDVLFESAAEAYRDGLVAVLLTGANEDGALGLSRVKEHGGYTIAQDPDTAVSATMPRAAIRNRKPDAILKLGEIGSFLNSLRKGVVHAK